MFLRFAIILIFLVQPLLTLTGSLCRVGFNDESSKASCCCHDIECPSHCPCMISDDSQSQPNPNTPAPLPARDQLLVVLGLHASLEIDPVVDHPVLTPPEQWDTRHASSRAFRARLGIWLT